MSRTDGDSEGAASVAPDMASEVAALEPKP